MVKLIDSFMFNGESIVQFRLQCMAPYMDKIYITESWYSHSGVKKEKLFIDTCSEWFKPYLHQIEFLIIDEFPVPTPHDLDEMKRMFIHTPTPESWFREKMQRNRVQLELAQWDHQHIPYLVFVADVDEILKPSILEQIRRECSDVEHIHHDHSIPTFTAGSEESKMDPTYVGMDFYYYSWYWKKPYTWTAPFFTHKNDHDFSLLRYRGYFLAHRKTGFIPHCGYHLSYFGQPEALIHKLENLAHTENNSQTFKSEQWIYKCLLHGIDILDRGTQESMRPANTLFPISMVSRSQMFELKPRKIYVNSTPRLSTVRRPVFSNPSVDLCHSQPTLIDQLIAFLNRLFQAYQNQESYIIVDGFMEFVDIEKCMAFGVNEFFDLKLLHHNIQSSFPHWPVVILDRTEFIPWKSTAVSVFSALESGDLKMHSFGDTSQNIAELTGTYFYESRLLENSTEYIPSIPMPCMTTKFTSHESKFSMSEYSQTVFRNGEIDYNLHPSSQKFCETILSHLQFKIPNYNHLELFEWFEQKYSLGVSKDHLVVWYVSQLSDLSKFPKLSQSDTVYYIIGVPIKALSIKHIGFNAYDYLDQKLNTLFQKESQYEWLEMMIVTQIFPKLFSNVEFQSFGIIDSFHRILTLYFEQTTK